MLAIGLKAFEYAKHLLGRLAIGTVRHQFSVPQDGVERRAQLMTHIGKELRLVLARLFKLVALFLDFVKQPHVLDRDPSLVSEGGSQLYLLIGKRAYRFATQNYHSGGVSFSQEWDAEDGVEAGPL